MAPATFSERGGGSVVSRQPATPEARVQALQALLSCPTNSIHADDRSKEELHAAQQGMPTPVPGCPNVYHTGWHSVASYAGTPYFITHPSGNILVDSPRFNPILAKRLEEMGGVSVMFLTHKDDVGDHAAWAKRLGCTRVLHASEVTRDTSDVEVQLQGQGPWDIRGNSLAPSQQGSAAPDVQLIFTPGHTKGHVCLFHAPSKALFTGDHLSQDTDHPEELVIFDDFNWHSVPKQLDSVARLRDYDFLTVLPAHGRRIQLRDAAHREGAIDRLLARHGHRVTASAVAS